VAAALETSEANSRQIVARARKHIQERRPRFPVDRERQLAVMREFLTACATGDPSQLTALLSIVTLPLGVLQLPAASPHAIRFTPDLRGKRRALARLASGPVIKLVMNFVRPFWAELHDGRYRDAAFFFANDAAFPTFWTTLPVRSSTMKPVVGTECETRIARTESPFTLKARSSGISTSFRTGVRSFGRQVKSGQVWLLKRWFFIDAITSGIA